LCWEIGPGNLVDAFTGVKIENVQYFSKATGKQIFT